MTTTCNRCHGPLPETAAVCPRCGPIVGRRDEPVQELALPTYLGRYLVCVRLAGGAFATVYQGRDEELGRDLAVKMLHPRLLRSPKVLEAFLNEARILASLNHPAIVPIYDVGHNDNGIYYLVTRLIEGCDLRQRLKEGRIPRAEGAEIVARIAEALHHAHRHGLVHRDVKPGNILLERDGAPLLVDFGLALRREDFGKGPTDVGTPLYMSPEQARGEGHRVDARSDVYSLGVVFYLILTGCQPFRASTHDELRTLICAGAAEPPRRLDAGIPAELERICLKAMARRAADRYPSAQAFADDLRFWQQSAAAGMGNTREPSPRMAERRAAPTRIVPRGLRPFEESDAGFFLDLLPGPRDRDGVPESVSFWKVRLETADAALAFRVGVLYGPSGCGKSSLIRAGLVPRLDPRVVVRFVVSEPEGTEPKLLDELRRSFPGLAADLGLAETLAALREGNGLPESGKLVVVFDQFEQWMQTARDLTTAPLAAALRQCDGARVQAVLLVRDDFWLPLTRLLRELEVPLRDGVNAAVIDRFDLIHVRHVLSALGRAYGRLSDDPSQWTADQNRFLDLAAAGLAQEEQVVPVRLSAFVELIKDRPWAPATWHGLGGAEGAGVRLLDEAFGGRAPERRGAFRGAAAAVLGALLPEGSGNLKGRCRSRAELLEVSGYALAPARFDTLLTLLDQELRLVTAVRAEDGAEAGAATSEKFVYELAHDFLVPALRHWLLQEQRQTYRGRAALRLAAAAETWSRQPGRRSLPAWWEWVDVRLFTSRKHWTATERRLMRSADRHYLAGTVAALILVVLTVAGVHHVRARIDESNRAAYAERLVTRIEDFHASNLAQVQQEVASHRQWAVPGLERIIADPESSRDEVRHARLVLLPLQPEVQIALLTRELWSASPLALLEIRAALVHYKDRVTPEAWRQWESGDGSESERFRVACVLAGLAPTDPRWPRMAPEVVYLFLTQNDFDVDDWLKALEPVREHLLEPLVKRFHGADLRDQVFSAAALARLAADHPPLLTDLVLDADGRQFERLWPPMLAQRRDTEPRLVAVLRDPAALHRRQARAAAVLARLENVVDVWPLLRHAPDPTRRSFLIRDFAVCGVPPALLVARFEVEPDVSARRALLLALGDYPPAKFAGNARQTLLDRFAAVYRADPDAGLHAATGWLLWRWGPASNRVAIDGELALLPRDDRRAWYVNRQALTMVLIPGNARHFEISATEITVAQYQRFRSTYQRPEERCPEAGCPVIELSWYDAAAYCRWLSEREAIPETEMCYPPLDQIKKGMKLPADYLTRTGYRVPTHAEWHLASQASARTPWFCGAAAELLQAYAWDSQNSEGYAHRVAERKPNDFGLFDVYGNVWEWTDSGTRDASGDELLVGGGYVRNLTREWTVPSTSQAAYHTYSYGGVRVARTRR